MKLEKKYKIKKVSWVTVKHLFLNYHYLKRMPAGILAVYAMYEKENDFAPVGGAVFTNGRIQYDYKYIEFARMYLYDEIEFNAESWFIGKCIKEIKKNFDKYEGIVSWADLNLGHNGTIYKASNFKFDGFSRPTQRYKNKRTKKIVFQRTVINPEEFEKLPNDKPKLRFIYYFDRKKHLVSKDAKGIKKDKTIINQDIKSECA